MNRRDFTKSLAALGLSPVLPIPAAGAPAAAHYTPYMYGLGAHLARASGGCSAQMLMHKLRLPPEAARAMQTQLIRNGVIRSTHAAGIARATRPYMRGVVAQATRESALGKAGQTLLKEASATAVEAPSEPDEM